MAKRKAKAPARAGRPVSVIVARMGSDPVTVALGKVRTVNAALALAGITPNEAETYYVNGEASIGRKAIEDGDTIVLVTPKQAGV